MKSNTKAAKKRGHGITIAEKNRVTGDKSNTKTAQKKGHGIIHSKTLGLNNRNAKNERDSIMFKNQRR